MDRRGAAVGCEERWSPAGFQELRALYEPSRRFAAVVGRWDVDPDDVVQDAYAKVLRRSQAEIHDLGPYLRRTIVNLVADGRRQERRATRVRARLTATAGTSDDYPSDLDDLMRLPARVRGLVYLVEVEGRPIASAAEIVGMSAPNARVALMRARRRLRSELDAEASNE
ncbi:MAG TPA: sigma factor-like helix-turn-helix DNA-binding protein [Acidimicrobiia bacterium]|nr:sigma factor-like helix-turn-helix DNA-binding protein [Acidimicrobiia bacterium]